VLSAVFPVSHEEMESAKVPAKKRDYCVHKWIEHEKCKRDEFPYLWRCHHAKHEYEHCEYEEYEIFKTF